MNDTARTAELRRLERLEGYLAADPQNPALLVDAFEAAMQAGAFDRAEFHLSHARALGRDGEAWRLREAHWLIAQQRHDEAESMLLALQRGGGPAALQAAVAHDLAYVALHRGHFEAGIAALRGCVDAEAQGARLAPATQALWLRLLHHAGRVDDACAWARERFERSSLSAEAAGVAALAAIDAGDAVLGQRWADHALQQGAPGIEALVARGTTALAQNDAALARRLLGQALEVKPEDGRCWSAMGLCELLERRFDAARAAFQRAVAALPEHIGSWHGLGWSALLCRDTGAAQRAFETALALDRNFGESHGGLAIVDALAGRREAARAGIARALKLDPVGLAARYAQAVLDGEAHDVQALQRLAQRLLGSRQAPFGGSVAEQVLRAASERG